MRGCRSCWRGGCRPGIEAAGARGKSQVERFRKIAQMIECDEDETRWDERLKKLAKAKSDKTD